MYLISVCYLYRDGNTSLHRASSKGKSEVVQILITAGCNTEIANNVSFIYCKCSDIKISQ